jgi:hypothetical protein
MTYQRTKTLDKTRVINALHELEEAMKQDNQTRKERLGVLTNYKQFSLAALRGCLDYEKLQLHVQKIEEEDAQDAHLHEEGGGEEDNAN